MKVQGSHLDLFDQRLKQRASAGDAGLRVDASTNHVQGADAVARIYRTMAWA
jgi:hypothetical protein